MLLPRNIYRNFVLVRKIETCSRAILHSRNLNTDSSKRHEIKSQYDIIIAGGGMVGCTLACALGKNKIPLFLRCSPLYNSLNMAIHLPSLISY